jgi:hypothetical protein
MRKRFKIDLEYIGGWIIAISVVAGATGAIIELIRYGAITVSGSIGAAGY